MYNVLAHIFKVSEFIDLYHIEIQVVRLWNYLDYKVGVHIEFTDDCVLDSKFTVIMHGEEECGVG